MKLTHPLAMRAASATISHVLRLWIATLRVRVVLDEPSLLPQVAPRRNLYLFWHEVLLLPAALYAKPDMAVMVSEHRDGELVAQVFERMGGATVRGSTTRGGVRALRRMIERQTSHLALTPDGPKGPRRVVQAGAVYLAAKTGRRIVPVGFGVDRSWRAPSWDRMLLPVPGSAAWVVFGEPLDVPAELDREGLEHYRRRAQEIQDAAQAQAEARAAGRATADAGRVYRFHQAIRLAGGRPAEVG